MIQTLLYDGCLYRKVGASDIQAKAMKMLKSYETLCTDNREREKVLFDAYESELMRLIDAFRGGNPAL